MTNSTTPDSPKCPTCGGHDTTGLCLSEALIREGKRAHHVPCVICGDPFHTSLPTAEHRDRTPSEQIEFALRMWRDQSQLSAQDYERKYYPETHPDMPSIHIKAAVARMKAAHPSETRAGEQEGSTAHLAIDCTSRYCAEHRDTWHHYEKAIAAPVQTGEGSTLTQQEKVNRAANNAFDAAVATVGGSTGPDTPQQFFYDKSWMWDVTYGHMWPADSNKAVFQFAQEYEQSKRINAVASVQGETLSDRINALPEWARQHIHDIETKCDPAGDIRTIGELRDTVAALEDETERLREGWTKCINEKFDLASQLKAAQQELAVQNASLTSATALICGHVDRAEAAETLVAELRTLVDKELADWDGDGVMPRILTRDALWEIKLHIEKLEIGPRTLKKEDGNNDEIGKH